MAEMQSKANPKQTEVSGALNLPSADLVLRPLNSALGSLDLPPVDKQTLRDAVTAVDTAAAAGIAGLQRLFNDPHAAARIFKSLDASSSAPGPSKDAPSELKIGGKESEMDFEGKHYKIRVVEATATRPCVTYLPNELMNAWLTGMELARGAFPEAAAESARAIKGLVGIIDGAKHMFLRMPDGPLTREQRLDMGETIAHEWEHYKGGKEGNARIAENEYRRRNGLEPKHGSRLEMLDEVWRLYAEKDFLPAAKELFGSFQNAELIKYTKGRFSEAEAAKAIIGAYGSVESVDAKAAVKFFEQCGAVASLLKNEIASLLKKTDSGDPA